LNLATLQIKDEEIAKKIDDVRAENFGRLFWTITSIDILQFVYYLLRHLLPDSD